MQIVETLKNPANAESILNDNDRTREAKKATGAAVFGTFIEYYDFSVYGYVAATLATVFFPSENPTIGLLNTMLVFGSAFIVRPLGAIAFGWLGDNVGRRTSLIACITMIGLSATLIGLLPGYDKIGVWAPILLVILRMMQGFSAGGEIGGAASYIREWAAPDKRPLYISFLPTVGQFGKGLAAGFAGLMAANLTGPDLLAWGWRVPFLLAFPLGILGRLMRLRIADSPEFTEARRRDGHVARPFRELMKNHSRSLYKAIGIAVIQTIGTYIGTVFIAVYLSSIVGFTKPQASTIVLVAITTSIFLIPMAGFVGTRIGSLPVLRLSFFSYALISFPSFLLMQQGHVSYAMIGLVLGMIPYALCQAGTYSVIPELFPVRIRHTGVAFGHSVGAVIGGGAGPYIATWLIDLTGSKFVPAYMMIIAGVVGLVILMSIHRKPVDPAQPDGHLFS